MTPVPRSDRVADQLRSELANLLSRDVHDPGIGFVTLTRVQLSADLQSARVFYTSLGDEAGRRNSARALGRAVPFLRRQIGSLRRFKDDVSEVKTGFECGIGFDKFNDLKVGDMIEVFAMERVLTPA